MITLTPVNLTWFHILFVIMTSLLTPNHSVCAHGWRHIVYPTLLLRLYNWHTSACRDLIIMSTVVIFFGVGTKTSPLTLVICYITNGTWFPICLFRLSWWCKSVCSYMNHPSYWVQNMILKLIQNKENWMILVNHSITSYLKLIELNRLLQNLIVQFCEFQLIVSLVYDFMHQLRI